MATGWEKEEKSWKGGRKATERLVWNLVADQKLLFHYNKRHFNKLCKIQTRHKLSNNLLVQGTAHNSTSFMNFSCLPSSGLLSPDVPIVLHFLQFYPSRTSLLHYLLRALHVPGTVSGQGAQGHMVWRGPVLTHTGSDGAVLHSKGRREGEAPSTTERVRGGQGGSFLLEVIPKLPLHCSPRWSPCSHGLGADSSFPRERFSQRN